MYLPAMIWFTSLAGSGEKPGPTTNCWSARKRAVLLVLQATPWDVPAKRLRFVRANDDAVDIKGEANVEMKDGTTKGSGLPSVAAVLVWNPVPEFKKPRCSVKWKHPQKRQVKLEWLKWWH